MIGDSVEGSLHIDETGFPKQGSSSVGVQRQYCGRLGKVDNCQVGVVLGYAHKNQRILIDGQLYLPEEWAKDKELRNKCKVPKDVHASSVKTDMHRIWLLNFLRPIFAEKARAHRGLISIKSSF